MRPMTGVNEIRSTFTDFFVKNGHEHVASSSLVPRNDPTLMFTSAGMVQFKNVFTGQDKRPYARATTAQKCVRAGGKHNDLDNVGYTARHHTFFEMLGNFSFGDYFKEQAIAYAWEFVTKVIALPKDKLLITVHPDDAEARQLWKKIAGIGNDRIIDIADNIWAAGPTGPCGYCSELFFDQGDALSGGPPGSPDEDGDRFLEFWNLVFMQFDQVDEATRVDLPRPSIDTGMGLERITAILQGVPSNYDIDLFRALIAASEDATGVAAAGEHRASHRVIADHLRSTSFLIAEGVLPSNEGRGYVLRRIMRRGMRHAQLLGAADPLLHRLVPALVRQMGETYPELVRAQQLITQTLRLEETKFRQTLQRGMVLLDEATTGLAAGATLSGDVAFKLYDTFGFPLDLTQDALKPRGIGVDTTAFDGAMERQKAEARRAWKGSGEAATETVWFEINDKVGATEFLGYEAQSAEGIIRGVFKDGTDVAALASGDTGAIVVNQTPFYGESGGQVGDTGIIRTTSGATFRVTDTQKKLGDLIIHNGTVASGSFKPGDIVELAIDQSRRSAIRANHSATHLLHEALRQVLGTHVAQKGSLVDPDRLRFDFSHTKPITPDEIARIETLANDQVLLDTPVETRLMNLDEARDIGAMALFGEKYGDEVRVVAMGARTRTAEGGRANDRANRAWSVELCGGTHVGRTGEIGVLRVVAETGSSAGVRRIEALTAKGARAYLAAQDARVRELSALLRTRPDDVIDRVKALVEHAKALEKQLGDAKRAMAVSGTAGQANGASASGDEVRTIGTVKYLGRLVKGLDPKDLRSLVDDGKKQIGSGIVAIVGVTEDGKAGLAIGVTSDLIGTYSAVELVRVGAEALGGKGGGGRPDMAQAGGADGSKAPAALAAIEAQLGG